MSKTGVDLIFYPSIFEGKKYEKYKTTLRKNKLKDAYFNKISKYFSEERFI